MGIRAGESDILLGRAGHAPDSRIPLGAQRSCLHYICACDSGQRSLAQLPILKDARESEHRRVIEDVRELALAALTR